MNFTTNQASAYEREAGFDEQWGLGVHDDLIDGSAPHEPDADQEQRGPESTLEPADFLALVGVFDRVELKTLYPAVGDSFQRGLALVLPV